VSGHFASNRSRSVQPARGKGGGIADCLTGTLSCRAVASILSTHVEVYVFRRRRGRLEFLALRRSPDRRKLPGVWQPVTGKRERGETALGSAVRELAEETGLQPVRWWALETVTMYVENDALMMLPLFAAEVKADAHVRLSDEHDAFAFVTSVEAARRYLWKSQRRGLEAVRSEVLDRPVLARALEVTDQVRDRGERPTRRRRTRAKVRTKRRSTSKRSKARRSR